MTLGSTGQVSSFKNSWKQKAPITSFQISKSSAIIPAFKMSLERYLLPTEWTDSKTLNERHFKAWEVSTPLEVTEAEISPFKKNFKNHGITSVHLLCWPSQMAKSNYSVSLSVDWDMAGGKMRNTQVSWCTVTRKNGMEDKTKAGRWVCLHEFESKMPLL